MPTITVYGGANEIGGNKILVESNETRLMLDFGRRMGYDSLFFSEFLDARSNTELRDRLIINALPKIPGIYRDALIRPTGAELLTNQDYKRILTTESQLLELDGLETHEEYVNKHGKGYLDGILLSHAHMDHTGDMGFIHPDIPLYSSEITHILVQAIDDVTKFKSEAIDMKIPELNTRQKGMFPGAPFIKKEGVSRDCRPLQPGEITQINNLNVQCIDVDHSVPGASSFIIESEENGTRKRILYTGDIRFHGTKPISVDTYVESVGSIDIMLCEGTRVDSTAQVTENDVKEKIIEEIKGASGLVFVDFSWKDTTRYETIRDAARECGRIFVVNARLAYVLNKLGQYPKKEDIQVFLKRKGSALYSPDDYTKEKHELGISADGEDIGHYNNGIAASDIIGEPERYILMLSYFELNQIFDFVNAEFKIPGSVFIKAQCEPFSDEMELDEERMINWLDTFGISYVSGEPEIPPGCTNPECSKIKHRMDRSHVSGHASRQELKEMLSKIKPSILIPIHTENPDAFVIIAKEIIDETGHHINVIKPESGTSLKL